MNNNINRKQKYINVASEILQSEGREGISIRRIASEAGCSSAVLYKHFENLDHLIMLAAVQFLEPYMEQMNLVSSDKSMSPIQLNLTLWKRFLNEAFAKKEYYEMMFVSAEGDRLKECVEEYHEIFGEGATDVDPISAYILSSNSIQEREYTRLKIASEQGLITPDNAKILSSLVEAVFAGRLTQYNESVSVQDAAEECYELIFSLYEKYVNPGVSLDIIERSKQ